jgi:copper chaperone CopZ/NAD-dependent dihydropyrimidine dehydrogenase PreA subunit
MKKTASPKKKRRNYYRLSAQLFIWLSLAYMVIRPFFDSSYFADFEAYCPFGGMQSLASYFQSNSLACSMTTVQISTGIALLVGVVLVSKLFCSYICPIGSLTEWMGKLGRKSHLQITLSGKIDQYFRLLKYVLLFVTFYFTITASELFCRKFDPFYAAFTGFSGDVFIWYAIPALLLTIAGSYFIRQFWCKYLCPLGAATNLAVYALPMSAIALLWTLLKYGAGINIQWPWLLGALCVTGFVLEAFTLKFFIFPSLRITRNDALCTHCRICDKACPMAIKISDKDDIKHIDCHLCADCVVKCPEKGALTINKKQYNWLPLLLAVLLTISALWVSSRFELPTISEQWGKGKSNATLKIEGLKSIKCFGSSRSFANQMKEVNGVFGVETYVKHHRVVVYYDSTIVSANQVKESIFSPFSVLIKKVPENIKSIYALQVGIDKCFDPNDQRYLQQHLQQTNGILAFSTKFGEPVQATIYFDSAIIQPAKIIQSIEDNKLIISKNGEETIINTDFKVIKLTTITKVDRNNFLKLFVAGTDTEFNKYANYQSNQLSVYEIDFEQLADPYLWEWIPYLVSHMSNNDGIVRFQSLVSENGPILRLWFVNTMTQASDISKMLTAGELTVHYPDKTTKKVKNPFKFPL